MLIFVDVAADNRSTSSSDQETVHTPATGDEVAVAEGMFIKSSPAIPF